MAWTQIGGGEPIGLNHPWIRICYRLDNEFKKLRRKRYARRHQHRARLHSHRRIPVIGVIRHRAHAIDVGKARTVQKLHQSILTGVECNVAQSLIFRLSFVPHGKNRFVSGKANPFDDRDFSRHLEKIANCDKRIFEVVKEPQAHDEVELAERTDAGILRISLSGIQSRDTVVSPRLHSQACRQLPAHQIPDPSQFLKNIRGLSQRPRRCGYSTDFARETSSGLSVAARASLSAL